MSAQPEELLSPVRTIQLGRKKTLHAHPLRVLIEDGQVVVRTLCGEDTTEGFTEADGFVSCEPCLSTPRIVPVERPPLRVHGKRGVEDVELPEHLSPTHDRAAARGSETTP